MTDDSNRDFSGAVNQRPMMRGDGCTVGNPMSDWKTEALRRFGPIPAGAGENSRLIAAYHYAFIEGAKAALALSSTDRAAPPSVALEAGETWAYIERLLHDECGLRLDEGLGGQRANCINAIRNGNTDPALLAAAVEFLNSGEGLHKIRVNGKMMSRKDIAASLTRPQPGGAVAGTERGTVIEPIESVGMRGANKQAHADHASMVSRPHHSPIGKAE